MALPLYLAMTAAEMGGNAPLPDKFAYMACHFSPYGTGLSNLPKAMPPGSMLIVNDRIPICGHDKRLITNQLMELVRSHRCSSVLLDFQHPGSEETDELVNFTADALPCPVGVSEAYAQGLKRPVLLPPVPLDIPLAEYVSPWKDREIWLEAALDSLEITLTPEGASHAPLSIDTAPDDWLRDEPLHCHYSISTAADQVGFTLQRTREDLDELLAEAESLGITRAVGLWQELG